MTSAWATERERICECQVFPPDCENEIAEKIMTDRERYWEMIDTAASSVWVDAHWFLACGGNVSNRERTAAAATAATDGHAVNVVGTGHLSFYSWSCSFREIVVVSDPL